MKMPVRPVVYDLAYYVLLVLACLVPLASVAYPDERGIWRLNTEAMASPDEPSYLLMAKSLLTGHGLSTQALAGREAFYPPGLGVILAGWGRVFGFSAASAHLCVAVTMGVALLLAHLLARAMFEAWGWSAQTARGTALAAVWLAASNYHVLDLTCFVFSEPAFTAATCLWLLAMVRWPRWYGSWWQTLTVAALAAAATAIRSAGIVCFATVLTVPALAWAGGMRRSRRAAQTGGVYGRTPLPPALGARGLMRALLIVLAVVVAYYAGLHLVSREASIASGTASANSYTKQLVNGLTDRGKIKPMREPLTFAYHVGHLAMMHLDDWAQNFAPPFRGPPRTGVYNVLARVGLLIACAGWLVRLAGAGRPRDRGDGRTRAVEVYVLFYVGLYALWPFFMTRFWVPIFPLMLAYLFGALRDFGSGQGAEGLPRRQVALWGALIGLMLVLNAQEDLQQLPYRLRRLNYVSACLADAAATVRGHVENPQDAVVCVSGGDNHFAMAWYLTEAGLPPPRSPRPNARVVDGEFRDERVEDFVWRTLEDTRPPRRVFLVSYFEHDAKVDAEPIMTWVLGNLGREHPAFDRRWRVVKLRELWNTTAVWEIQPAAPQAETAE